MLRIAHFSWEFPPAIWGGLGTFALEISKKQVSQGNEVTVFALNDENKLNSADHWNGVEVYRAKSVDAASILHLFSNKDLQSWGDNFQFFSDVIEYNMFSAAQLVHGLVQSNQREFDIIDGHDWLGIIGGMIAKKNLNLPLVFHVHSTEQGRSLGGGSDTIKRIELEGGKRADCIITVSYAMKDELCKMGFPEEKIRVCWNGVDPEKYDANRFSMNQKKQLRSRYGILDHEKMLFFVGRLVTVKGADKLVKAMPEVLKDFPDVKLVLLGVGDMESTIRDLIDEYHLEERVILRNEFVDEETRMLHYAASDMVVLPSLYEPFGIVCTEGMAMGKPVVVGARGTNGMREQIVSSGENQCGVHINPFDPVDIAWGIKQVLDSEQNQKRMGMNARKRVLEVFTWDAISKRTVDIYREFAAEKAQPKIPMHY